MAICFPLIPYPEIKSSLPRSDRYLTGFLKERDRLCVFPSRRSSWMYNVSALGNLQVAFTLIYDVYSICKWWYPRIHPGACLGMQPWQLLKAHFVHFELGRNRKCRLVWVSFLAAWATRIPSLMHSYDAMIAIGMDIGKYQTVLAPQVEEMSGFLCAWFILSPLLPRAAPVQSTASPSGFHSWIMILCIHMQRFGAWCLRFSLLNYDLLYPHRRR